jgi:nitrate reductase gamma subunit
MNNYLYLLLILLACLLGATAILYEQMDSFNKQLQKQMEESL